MEEGPSPVHSSLVCLRRKPYGASRKLGTDIKSFSLHLILTIEQQCYSLQETISPIPTDQSRVYRGQYNNEHDLFTNQGKHTKAQRRART